MLFPIMRCLLPALLFTACAAAQAVSAKTFKEIADTWVRQQLEFDPTLAYLNGLPIPVHVHFANDSPESSNAWAMQEQTSLTALLALDANQLPTALVALYASLREQLEADLQLRSCRTELWNINHFSGWQSTFAQLAEQQPVVTVQERDQALALWADLPCYRSRRPAAWLRLRLRRSAVCRPTCDRSARSARRRPAGEVALCLQNAPPTPHSKRPSTPSSPLVSIQLFCDIAIFLRAVYLPHARTSTAISDLLNGMACYEAFLRQNTTLHRTPQEVYDLGNQFVAAYTQEILRIGREQYHTTTLAATLAAASADPASHYTSREDLLSASRATLIRASALTASRVIDRMSAQAVIIEPLRPFQEAAGASSRMEANPNVAFSAVYRPERTPLDSSAGCRLPHDHRTTHASDCRRFD